MPASASPAFPPGSHRAATQRMAPMVSALGLSLLVSIPTAVAIVSGRLSTEVLVVLAAVIPIGLAATAIIGTARADRAALAMPRIDAIEDELHWYEPPDSEWPPSGGHGVDLRGH